MKWSALVLVFVFAVSTAAHDWSNSQRRTNDYQPLRHGSYHQQLQERLYYRPSRYQSYDRPSRYQSYYRPSRYQSSLYRPSRLQWTFRWPSQWWNVPSYNEVPEPAASVVNDGTTTNLIPTTSLPETVEAAVDPGTTVAPEAAAAPETTVAPKAASEATAAPETTVVPEAAAVPETTVAPEAVAAPETTVVAEAPVTTVAPEAAAASETTVVAEAPVTTVAPEATAAPETPASQATTASPTTEAPLMPGLHPTGSHSCAVNELPIGAYQVQVQMPDGSVQMHHYLVCNTMSSAFRGPLVGVATTRAATCTADAPVYAGFWGGKGPCAPLAPGWKMTTTCKNGDNQGKLPASLPANYIRYIGCGGIPGDTDYALTQYTTSNSGDREELQAVTCCKVVPV